MHLRAQKDLEVVHFRYRGAALRANIDLVRFHGDICMSPQWFSISNAKSLPEDSSHRISFYFVSTCVNGLKNVSHDQDGAWVGPDK